MPRRRPHELRVRRSDAKKEPGLPRGSARLVSALARLERNGIASVAAALRTWRAEAQSRVDDRCPCGCNDMYFGHDARSELESAMRALPPRLARELRSMVVPLDELYWASTVPDPFASPSASWWRRRMASS
ncbi:hypothetical protein [Kutzneria sp. NPDC051319]|uniref:hypothetical protein n=1 Tax=Kutzneria sp. NPDC051319 TaxID=3155047 RepID=UPI003443ECC6